ncbi:MAG: MopE-related protein, partial [Phycisphaerales bacterium]
APSPGVGGSVTYDDDCDDSTNLVHPGAAESCANLAVDNDCDGDASADEASDSVAYYVDSDGDGYGSGPATMSCSAIQGSVTNNTDGCPSDANKLSAGVCGCGSADTDADSNGIADCADVYIAMGTAQTQVAAGGTLTVRVSSSSSLYTMNRIQLAVAYDASRLEFLAAAPVSGGPFQTEYAETADDTLGTLTYTIGVSGSQAGMNAAADLCDLVFRVRSSPSQPLCGSVSLVGFAPTGTVFTRDNAAQLVPVSGDLAALDLDSVPPVFSGIPASVTVACDAGSIYGAFVADLTLSVAAVDDCDGAISFSGPTWPANGMFPIGTTTLTWTATDSTGNSTTESRTVPVLNYQLLDATVSLTGPMTGSHTRAIRVKAGSSTQVVNLAFTNGVATLTGHQVPVAESYACIEVKDTVHTLSRTAAPSIVGPRYSAIVSLLQGDSNNDNLVDIIDFGLFLSDRGAGKAEDARSNFDGDALVNTADFTFLTLSFFGVGQTCSSSAAPTPRERVSVKDLRRAGLGEAAVADFNRDGWVDMRDLQLYMQGGAPQPQLGGGR